VLWIGNRLKTLSCVQTQASLDDPVKASLGSGLVFVKASLGAGFVFGVANSGRFVWGRA
jgi:hypothetical protein